MSRNLKTLLVAAMAVSAMAVFWASAAQAEPATEFTNPEGEVTTLTTTPDGSGTTAHQVFDTPAGSITCNSVSLHGEAEGTSSEEQTMAISSYNDCKFLGFIGVVVKPNGCDYLFEIGAPGAVHVECPEGAEITFEAVGCKVRVPDQDPEGGVTFHNVNGGTEITASPNVTNIKGTAEGCPFGNGAFTNGQYTTGNTIITGEDPDTGVMKPISVS